MENYDEKKITYQHSYEALMNQEENIKLSANGLGERGNEDLIIDGNTVYEIDRKCCEKSGRLWNGSRHHSN